MTNQREKELINQAKKYYDQAKYRIVQNLLSEVIEINPKNIDAYFMMANIFHRRGEIGKAIKAFNKVLTLDPNHTDASISLSVLYNDIGRYEEGRKVFERANERVKAKKDQETIKDDHINKKFSFKHYEIAEMYMTYNRFDEALFEYNKAIGLDPENLDARLKIAKVYAKKGFISKAVETLKLLKNEKPEFLDGRVALGVLYYGNGNIIEAQNEWQKVISKDPHHSEAAMYLNLSHTATETSL